MMIRRILSEYQAGGNELRRLHDHFKERLGEVLGPMNADVHLIAGRVKSEDSLIDKLLDRHHTYAELKEVTDVIGMRVITYCENRVEPVVNLLRESFPVIQEKSAYVRSNLQPHEFGYISTHIIVAGTLPDSDFGMPVEIQVRSILQHSWAENEHSMGYDNPLGLPEDLKRRLHRLAALLELADEEMNSVDAAIRDYNREVIGRLSEKNREFPINVFSIEHLIENNALIEEMDREIAAILGAELHASHSYNRYIPFHLIYTGFRRLTGVLNYATKHRDDILRLVRIAGSKMSLLANGITLWYVCLHRACAPRNVGTLEAYIRDNEIEITDANARESAERLLAALEANDGDA